MKKIYLDLFLVAILIWTLKISKAGSDFQRWYYPFSLQAQILMCRRCLAKLPAVLGLPCTNPANPAQLLTMGTASGTAAGSTPEKASETPHYFFFVIRTFEKWWLLQRPGRGRWFKILRDRKVMRRKKNNQPAALKILSNTVKIYPKLEAESVQEQTLVLKFISCCSVWLAVSFIWLNIY